MSVSGAGARTKGIAYERAVLVHLQQAGIDATNLNRSGYDGSDIAIRTGFAELSVEVKNQAKMVLSQWCDQACKDSQPTQIPLVIHKRRLRSDVGEHYATMRVADLIRLLDAAETLNFDGVLGDDK